MSRILRLVRFSATPEGAAALEQLVSRDVVPINTRFGSETCRVIRALDPADDFAIISVWSNREQLDAMRAQPDYQALVAGIKQHTVSGLHETLYEVLA
ncbi:MAG TPA: antibiotic biosynthesis monooxygenase [Ktedonobacterales bacterium]|nr:antibiotic biosynthesis monooxygenase [Ktedonobacterales bacterium]